ncbi:MAG: hypothetical protein IJM68_00750 [Synergistaceae bacterium]|nr:hypothetical protein [Synergistaceae bacterium]
MAARLVNIGLAHIGRITQSSNPCLTPEQTEARHRVERPFLTLLADRYKDGATRKELARHFMVYKEMTLFMIYATVLKKDATLHAKVRTKLKGRLSLGLPTSVVRKRDELWRSLSEKFYESYTRTKDMGGTLEYVFWSTLPERLRLGDVFGGEYLKQIFEYSREAIVREAVKHESI